MANVVETPAKTVEQQLEFLQHNFDSLFACFGEAMDENKLLKRRIRLLERHITNLSLKVNE